MVVTEDTMLLDVGAKRDAVVPRRELVNLDETVFDDISIGDQIPVYVTNTSSYDNELLVSIENGLAQQDWDRAETYLDSEETLELNVIGYNKGGLLVEFGRLSGFVPNSMVPGMPRGMNANDKKAAKVKMIGMTLQVNVIEVDQSRERFVLSGRAAEGARRKQRLQELQVGARITGTVSNVVDFGVFVELDGVDGLIHVSKLTWKKVKHPSEILQPGDEVEALVKEVDLERERVSLDRRTLLPNPWDKFTEQYHEGDIIEREVTSVQDFGAFIDLTDEITGLLHISELLPGVSHAIKDVLTPGDKLLVSIIEIDTERERVSLSMRRVPQDDLARWVIESQDDSLDEENTEEEQN